MKVKDLSLFVTLGMNSHSKLLNLLIYIAAGAHPIEFSTRASSEELSRPFQRLYALATLHRRPTEGSLNHWATSSKCSHELIKHAA